MERLMKQLTQQQAIEIADSELYKDMTDKQIVDMQLFQNRLCMPFSIFHKAVESVLNRSVFTHEFGLNVEGLRSEYLGGSEPPTFEEILELIPNHKRIIIEDNK